MQEQENIAARHCGAGIHLSRPPARSGDHLIRQPLCDVRRRIGAAAVMAFAVSGPLLAGILLDRIGFLGMAVREISVGRIGGALLLVAGALMIRFL